MRAPAMVDLKPVKSSNLKKVGYDAGAQALHIDFGRGVYVFHGVPPEKHRELVNAVSPGKYFAAQIRGKYEVKKPEKPKPKEAGGHDAPPR